MAVRIDVLGTLAVTVEDTVTTEETARPVSGSRLRALLTRLAVADGHAISIGDLVEAVWGDEPPAEAANALQSLVSRLRRTLGDPDLVVAAPNGYRLAVPSDRIDVHQFSRLAEDAQRLHRAGDPAAARAAAVQALNCWRGEPLTDAGDSRYAHAVVTTLEGKRLDLIGTKIEIDLGRGAATEVINQLQQLVANHPLRETFVEQLMRALAAAGRTGEALATYERCRSYLADQLGADPGPGLQELHLRLLRGESELVEHGRSDRASKRGDNEYEDNKHGSNQRHRPESIDHSSMPENTDADAAAGSAVRSASAASSIPNNRSHNLPVGLTSFVGRDAEVDQLIGSMDDDRLTTLVGTGGAGKTRTATEVARRWLNVSGSAAWMIELAPIRDGENIPGAMLAVLGDRDPASERTERVRVDEMRQLLDHLTDADCLLIFDNCEHLADEAAKIISEILAAAPGVRILATSREPLSIAGETLYELPPLPLPPSDCGLECATDYAAVRLWLDRARAIKANFTLTPDNLSAVLDIVRRLDGLPLAIELAAARLHALPVGEIARLLNDRFRLLTAGHRGGLPRHQTLAAVVSWSWDLLPTAERLLAERLSVFPAGAQIDAATAVCADDRLFGTDIPQLLISLADKSLLRSSAGSPVRFTMLETLREYGQQRLADDGVLTTARTAHAEHFYELALWLEPALRDDRQNEAMAVWEQERGNLLAALTWFIDSGRGRDALVMLLSQLWGYLARDQESELSTLLDRVITVNAGHDEPLLPYAEAARMIADLHSASDWYQIADQLRRVQCILTSAAEPPFASLAMMRRMPGLALRLGFGEYDNSIDMSTIADEMGEPADPWVRGMCYLMAATLCENNGQLEWMSECIEHAYADLGRTGDQWNLSRLLVQRARMLQLTGDTSGAIEALNESLRMYPAESDGGSLFIHLRLSELCLRLGDHQAAREQLDLVQGGRADLDRGRELGLVVDAAVATLEASEGNLDRALQQAADLRSQIAGSDLTSMFLAHAGAAVLAASACIELDGARAATDQQTRDRHRKAAAADLARGYPAAKLTLDLPIIAQFATAAAHLAESGGQQSEAAHLLGVGARLLGADDLSDLRRGELAGRLRPRLGQTIFTELYQAGQSLGRDAAIAAGDPERLEAIRSGS